MGMKLMLLLGKTTTTTTTRAAMKDDDEDTCVKDSRFRRRDNSDNDVGGDVSDGDGDDRYESENGSENVRESG